MQMTIDASRTAEIILRETSDKNLLTTILLAGVNREEPIIIDKDRLAQIDFPTARQMKPNDFY